MDDRRQVINASVLSLSATKPKPIRLGCTSLGYEDCCIDRQVACISVQVQGYF